MSCKCVGQKRRAQGEARLFSPSEGIGMGGGQTRVDMQGSNTDFTYVKPTMAGADFSRQLIKLTLAATDPRPPISRFALHLV
jgi:hypothetical protein